jgi:hypothetical protein
MIELYVGNRLPDQFHHHMASPWHKSDHPRVHNEDKVMEALRPLVIPPGDYMMPRPSSTADMRSPEFTEKIGNPPVQLFNNRSARKPIFRKTTIALTTNDGRRNRLPHQSLQTIPWWGRRFRLPGFGRWRNGSVSFNPASLC